MFPVTNIENSLMKDRMCEGIPSSPNRSAEAADYGETILCRSGQGNFSHLGEVEKFIVRHQE